ncbi:MAG: carboxypeptidase-like regulatory domain-containing protein [Terracidiphilus sp.]
MACIRIAVVVISLFLSFELSAQPAPQGNVTVQVTDRSGALVPGARIEIDLSASSPNCISKTDSQGRARFDLPTGAHTLSIAARGFKTWTRQIDVQSGTSQPIMATMEVAGSDDPILVVNWAPYELSVSSPEPICLPVQPLLNLDPLPTHKAKRHW